MALLQLQLRPTDITLSKPILIFDVKYQPIIYYRASLIIVISNSYIGQN